MDIQLRSFQKEDLPVFEKWLKLPYVAKWYHPAEEWLEEVMDPEGKYSWVAHYIAMYEGKAIGFCQFYDYERGGESWHGARSTANTYSIDYLLGEPEYLQRGLGREMVKALVKEIFSKTEAQCIIVQPEPANKVSRKTLLSAGFDYDDKNDLFMTYK